MINPITLRNMTRTIQSTELSMPRDFASRATQISSAMFRMNKTMGIKIIVLHKAHPAAAAAPSFCCANATERNGRDPAVAKINLLIVFIKHPPSTEWSLQIHNYIA